MDRDHRAARVVFGSGMIGLGILGLVIGDFAMEWQPVPPSLPGYTVVAYAAAVLMVACGVGLLFRRTATLAARVLLPYLVLWVLLKVPALIVATGMEAVWLGIGEVIVLMTGGWVLFARHAELREGSPLAFAAGASGLRIARYLFALALIPIGLSHVVYVPQTVELIPAWLPARTGWAYLTGAGQIAAGLGVLFSVLPRVAAAAEASMITIFTLLVWVPRIVAAPTGRLPWTACLISWAIGAGAWAVAGSIPARRAAEREAEPAPARAAGGVLVDGS
ncbi:MAG TPA: hypothetical protein VFL93_06425 [Longimicrobiaceae bacterium]|nr:hypothetical protein [Longimicrobiaceae bacterium]